VPGGAEVLDLYRVRSLDGVVTALNRSRVPLALAPELPEVDFTKASLYAELRNHGVMPTRTSSAMEATAANAEQASLLRVPVGAPLLHFSHITHDQNGKAIEIGDVVYRGDRYRFRANLVAPLRKEVAPTPN
jgi:DNA-binding GntR family transcriptional regulator